MEQVIKAYGRFLLEAAAVVLLAVLLLAGITDEMGNRGIFSMLGAYVDEEASIEAMDFAVYEEESRRSAPSIVYVGGETLQTGTYPVDALLRAADDTGREVPVAVCSICDPSGIERIGEYLSDISHIQFVSRGIYTLRVTAVDAWNRTSNCEVRIPVNGWEETN